MIILGIDPGTAITGFGVIKSENGQQTLVGAGVIRTKAGMPLPKRLKNISESINELINEFKPNEMAVEKLYFSKNVKTAMSVSHARGVILLCGETADLPIAEYNPLQVKQAITGYGGADKKQVQEMVKTLLGLKEVPKPDDAADALAVAICHAATLGA
ncbi:MAG: crossover junction endodeoxyribonuclease RuvC [Candidatus Saccharimonadales bacterium]